MPAGHPDDEGPEPPSCTLWELKLDAAAKFGCGLAEFVRQPVDWQAQMIAHMIIKGQKERYMAFKMRERERSKRPGKGGVFSDPSPLRKWMV